MPRQGASNEYPQHVSLLRTGENYPRIITKYSSLTSPMYIIGTRWWTWTDQHFLLPSIDSAEVFTPKRTTCTISVFWPTMELDELDMQDSSVHPHSHDSFKLTMSCIVRAWQIHCPAARDKSKFWLGKWFFIHLPRKMYRIYREYCNSEPFSRCYGMPGKWLKLGFVRSWLQSRDLVDSYWGGNLGLLM